MTQDTSYSDFQPAIAAANSGDVITASAGLYTGVNNQIQIPAGKQLTLMGDGAGSTVISGTNTGEGIYLLDGTAGVTITNITVRNFSNGFRFGNVSQVYIASSEAISNRDYGFYSNAISLSNITLRQVNASYNTGGASPRGLMFQVTNGLRQNIVVTGSVFNYNGLVGADFNIGSVRGLVFANNTLIGNGDAGLSANYVSGAQIWGNMLIDNGRFGMELKMPQGDTSLYPSSAGPVLVYSNTVSRTAPPNSATEGRDLAGIVVMRRAVEPGMPETPANVEIFGNTVEGYVQNSDHDGFGILVEGIAIQVHDNILNNNDVGLQAQETVSGTRGLPGDNATGGGAAPAANDDYFDRGNATQTCAVFLNNTFTGNALDTRNVGAVDMTLVKNLKQGTVFCAIQPAIDAANSGDVISAAAGVYTGTLNIVTIPLAKQPLTLIGAGSGAGQGSTIISGTNTGAGITLPDNTNGVTVTQLTIRNFAEGINGPAGGGTLSNVILDAVDAVSNTNRGFFSQAFGTANITLRNVNLSYNGNRGMWLINGAHNGITITGSTFRNNGLTGIDLSDGSASGVYIVSNTVAYNGDAGMGVLGLTRGAGPSLIASNVLTDNGRYGIEVKVPNGTGTETGDGSIVVRDNQITLVNPPSDQRDFAGIAVERRAKGAVNVDVPTGVVIRNNTITGYTQATAHEGFGIVGEGTAMRIISNTLTNNEVGLQVQKTLPGARNYPGDSVTGSAGAPEPNDTYFDRGNAIETCAVVADNVYAGNGIDFSQVGPIGSASVTNTNTSEVFCSIQSAIDDADTLNGHTIQVGPGTYTETVLVNKELTLLGANAGISPITGTRGAESIVIPDINNALTATLFAVVSNNVTLDGFVIDGDNPALSGGITVGGVDVNAARGIANNESTEINGDGNCPGWGSIQNLTVQNNVVRNLQRYGVALCSGTFTVMNGNHISNNTLINLSGSSTFDSRTGVILEGNAFAAISHNHMAGIRRGVRTTNLVGPGTPALIDSNVITAEVGGVMANLHYGSSQVFTVSNNTITAVTPGTGIGIRVWSIQGDTSVRVISNTVSKMSSGMVLWNLPTTNPVVINGGTLSNNARGIWVTNQEAAGPTSVATGGLAQNVVITGSSQAGIYVQNVLGAGGPVALTALGNTLTSNADGVIVESAANGQPVTFDADNNRISNSTNAGVMVSGTGSITTTLSGGPGEQNTFVNNGIDGNTNITVSAPLGTPAINALWNDWGALNLNEIEDTIFHNADNNTLRLVNYYTLTANVSPVITYANGLNSITYTANITGFYGNPAGAILSLTSSGAPNVNVPASATTDADGNVTLILTSTVAGSEFITATINGQSVTRQITFTASPQVVAVKASTPAANSVIGPDQPITYVVTVTPAASVLNLVITDSVPLNASYVAGSASASAGATLSGPNPFVVRVPAATAGTPITFTFAVTAPGSLNASLTITNGARVASASTPVSATNVITHFTGRVVRLRDSVWFTGYQVAINNANTIAGDTLLGMAGTYTENLSLTKGVSLTGVSSDTVIVRPTGSNRVLNVSGAAVSNGVVISGMTFTGANTGLTSDGAGIRVQNNARLTINDVTISNNTAGALSTGGGIATESSTVLTVTNSAILSNTAPGNGGGINALGVLVVSNTRFVNNRTTGLLGNGGAIFADASASISGSAFSNSTTAGNGGAIRTEGTVAITGSSFVGNTTSGALSNGGAVSINGNGTLSNNQFVSNTSVGGGAVSIVGGNSLISTSAFTGNTGTAGGAVYASGNGTLTITGTQFTQNAATNGGGALVRALSGNRAISVVNSTFTSNTANNADGGSAIYADALTDGDVTVQGSRFVNNRAPAGRGAIHYSSGNTLVITGSAFLGNTALGAGAVRVDGNSNSLIINSIFGRNSASASPAAIEANNASMTIQHTTIASPTVSALSAILVNNTSGFAVNVTNTLVLSHNAALNVTGAGPVHEDYNFFKVAAPTVGSVTSGGHSLTSGNAELADVANDDYHLTNGNLAVDAGIDTGISSDFEGNVRPRGLGFDIGAFESPYAATVDLTLSKTVTPGIALPGQTVVFILSARNINSVYAANGVVITDDLPAGFVNPVITSSGVPITQISGSPNFEWNVEPMLPNSNVVITITGVITDDAVIGDILTNTASISSTTVDSDTTNNTAQAAVQVGDLPRVSKDAAPASGSVVNPGDALVYTIVVTTQSDLANLLITDSLPSGIGYVLANGSVGTVSYSAPVVRLSVPFAPANTVITLTINATAPMTGNLTFTNTANVSSSTSGAQTSDPVSHTVAAPMVQFSSASTSAGESSGNAVLTVSLSHPSAVAVTVNYSTSDGTAQDGVDYTGGNSAVVFAPGVVTQTILVPLTSDSIYESDETFNATLSGVTNASLGANTSNVVTIMDDELPPTAQFASAGSTVNEDDASATLVATLNHPSAFTVTVNYATSNGSAQSGNDYVASSGVVTFAPGATTANVVVPLLEDVIDEPSETFDVSLSGPVSGSLGTPASHTVTIVDNDGTPTAQFDSAVASVDEGSGNALLTVTLSNPSVVSVTVTYNTSDDSAQAPGDYAATSGSILFPPGTTVTNISVPINEDVIDENTETFSVTLTAATNAAVGTPEAIAVQIVDNDGVPTMSFGSASISVNEGASTATLLVMLSNPSVNTVTATYGTSSGSAIAGNDFVSTHGTITFTPGSTTASINVPVLEDSIDESEETFSVGLGNLTNATAGLVQTATVHIVGNDGQPTVQFASALISVGEAGGGTTVTVTLSNPSADTVTVNYSTSSGSAVAGSDFGAASGTLTFAPGITTATFTVNISDDVFVEGNEMFNISLGNAVSATVGTPGSALIIIVDDDSLPTAQLDRAAYSAGEGDGSAVFTVTLSNASLVTVSVTYNTSNGSAQAPTDFTASGGSIVFAPGSTVATATVPILDDLSAEGNEDFQIALAGATDAVLGTPSTATITIVDNDAPPTAQFSSAAYTVNEHAGTAVLTVTLSNPSGLTTTVTYHTVDGTATAGNDYVAGTAVITFAPGSLSATIVVPVNEDTRFEGDENFGVVLDSITNGSLGTSTTATVTILDNDTQPTVQFASAATSANEDGGTATLVATLSNPSVTTVTVAYATNDGTATAGNDYLSASGTITFAPGTTLANIVVPISEDTIDDDAETFSVTLSGPAGAALGSTIHSVVTIIDNDGQPTAQFDSASYATSEAAGTTVLTVTLSNPGALPITVTYNTSDDTAVAPDDYTASSGSVSFAPGQTVATLGIAVKNDVVDDDNESFEITLTGATNASIGTLATAAVNIIDDDGEPTINFSNATYRVNEGAGSATVQLMLSNPSAETVSVDYATSNGSAVAGSDYQTATGTLSFPPGSTTASFNVIINEDAVTEGDELIRLTLNNAIHGTAGALDHATLIVIDNDGTPTVRFSQSGYSVMEGEANASVVMVLSQASTAAVTVNYHTSNGTALADQDYLATSGSVTFQPGLTQTMVLIPILDNDMDEANEALDVNLSGATNATVASPNVASITIVDDDGAPVVQFSQPNFTIEEQNGTVILTVTLSHASDKPIVLAYHTSDETAMGGRDYIAMNGTLSFAPGVTTTVLTLPILDDNEIEGNEMLDVVLTDGMDANAPVNPATPEAVTSARVIILDDEQAPPTLTPRAFLPALFAPDRLPEPN